VLIRSKVLAMPNYLEMLDKGSAFANDHTSRTVGYNHLHLSLPLCSDLVVKVYGWLRIRIRLLLIVDKMLLYVIQYDWK
jgi:hypothetical protein